MPPTLLAADAQPAEPWRNGGGVTRELLRWPAEGDWRLRISLADISQDGPFSTFEDVTRWFAVVQGGGLRLKLDDGEKRLLAGGAPLVFDGGEAPECELLGGPTRDLNLMLASASGGMALAHEGAPWVAKHAFRALFCASEAVLRIDDTAPLTVPAMGLCWSAQAGGQRWQLDRNPGLAWWLWADLDTGLR